MPLQKCAVCHTLTSACCADCEEVFYCSQEHQKLHWSYHRRTCTGRARWDDSSNSLRSSPDAALAHEPTTPIAAFTPSHSPAPTPIPSSKQKVESLAAVGIKQVGRELKMQQLKAERGSLREKVLNSFHKDGPEAFTQCSKLIAVSKEIKALTQQNFEHLQYLLDVSMLCKLMLARKQSSSCRQLVLKMLADLPEAPTRVENYPGLLKKEAKRKTDGEPPGQQSRLIRYTFAYCKAICLLAALLSICHQFSQAEKLYRLHVRTVQSCFGTNSLQTSSVLFSLGVWYYQEQKASKALGCFHLAREIRESLLGQNHQSISDCLFNEALCLRVLGEPRNAEEKLHACFSMRASSSGLKSLGVSQVLEVLGRQALEEGKVTAAFERLSECYAIRAELINDPKDPLRVSAQKLFRAAQKQMEERKGRGRAKQNADWEGESVREGEKENLDNDEEEFEEEEIEIRITRNMHDKLSLEQLEQLVALEESLKGVTSKKVGSLIARSDFLKALDKSQQVQFIRQNEKYFQ